MVEPDQAIWRKVLAHLRAQFPDLWRQWFEEIEPLTLAGGVFDLQVVRDVQKRYLARECARAFADAAQAATGRLISVRFHGPDDDEPAAVAIGAAPQVESHDPAADDDEALAAPTNNSLAPAARRLRRDELVLIPDYNFDNFVVGPNNQLAHAAAQGIAQNPGRVYNPLFIHGGVGLGKTHLLQAVCQRILEARPGSIILYISCEDFVTRFMDAVQAGQMAGFRHHFRDVDMLVIDDIHFLARRDRTQDEFFHTFNSLHQTNRQIILSSDAAPDEIPQLEDRLVSRFKWGLVAPIEAPGYETRVAIVKQKAKVRGVDLPEEVACLIAQRFDSNIRELEGALTRVQMQTHLEGGSITPDLARRALGVREAPAASRVTIETIVDAVTGVFDVTLSSLQSKRKSRSIALPRQVCMYLARKHTRYSLEEIGGYFGGRDHTTVLYAQTKVPERRRLDPEIDRLVHLVEARLQGSVSE